jgi:sulfur dioxygenase
MLKLDAREFLEYAQSQGIPIVDIREPEETAGGTIEGALLRPMSRMDEWVGTFDASQPLALFCRSGNRVAQLANALEQKGFHHLVAATGCGFTQIAAVQASQKRAESHEALLSPDGRLIFRQIFEPETSTYTYLVGDAQTREVALVDSVREHFPVYVDLIQRHKLKLSVLLETHLHADHITASSRLREAFSTAQIALSEAAQVSCEARRLRDGEEFRVGKIPVRVFWTPGHTNDDLSFLIDGNRLLTGDTFFINSCGRTDFQAGDSRRMYQSLSRLKVLPGETLLYPGHDYNQRRVSSLDEQLRTNALLAMTEEQFAAELASWKLNPPQKIKESLPANLRCGS